MGGGAAHAQKPSFLIHKMGKRPPTDKIRREPQGGCIQLTEV